LLLHVILIDYISIEKGDSHHGITDDLSMVITK
jgi:hypothetical protein